MCVKLVGYSERGMVNALCYDLLSSQDPKQVETFLGWIAFPLLSQRDRPCFTDIKNAQLIVEQSFSDFGDLDLLVLLEHNPPFCDGRAPARQAVLIEAKVSTDTNSWQTVNDRFGEFVRMIDGGEGTTSNLFVQLHRKMRLVEYLRSGRRDFEPDLFTPRGSLGTNHVVDRARQALESYIMYGGQEWYAAIVPDHPDDVASFARNLPPRQRMIDRLPRWDAGRWGFLSWRTVKAKVQAEAGLWPLASATFNWNEGQIFRDNPPVPQVVRQGQIYLDHGQHVLVVSPGRGQQCRVAELMPDDPTFFWTTRTVPQNILDRAPDPISAFVMPTRPQSGLIYRWRNRNDAEPLHPDDLIDGTDVEVIRPSWLTTRVRRADGTHEGDEFPVYTHYLERNPVG